jgi:peptide/nickel transport system ATP-binding protein
MKNPHLSIQDLVVTARHGEGQRALLRGLTLQIEEGRIVGLAGESGSGKTLLGAAISGLLPAGVAITGGSLLWRGEDLRGASEARLQRLRGAEIATIFQEPTTALNPTLRIGRQMTDAIRTHRPASDARALARQMLDEVRIDDPAGVLDAWPHQLSGGMRQRVLIAMAFACRPSLIIADEPTTALDVTVQAQVLSLLATLAREHRTAVLLITHDMGVVRRCCDEVHMLYAGRIVESGATADVLRAPRHPYTRALLDALPERAAPKSALRTLPSLPAAASGCAFRSRCAHALDRCREEPAMQPAAAAPHRAACWLGTRDEIAA